jgi:hypothetical protein
VKNIFLILCVLCVSVPALTLKAGHAPISVECLLSVTVLPSSFALLSFRSLLLLDKYQRISTDAVLLR